MQDTSGQGPTSQQHPTNITGVNPPTQTNARMPELGGHGAFGIATSRYDGPLKVTGRAAYAADHQIKDVVYAVAIQSPIANGRVRKIESSAASFCCDLLRPRSAR